MSPARRRAAVCFLAFAFSLVGCGGTEGPAATFPPTSIGPDRTVSPTVAQTRAELARVLGARSLQFRDVQTPVRPPEAAMLATAPRAVHQVILPQDPDRGFIVVYEFRDAAQASEAAAEEQRYLASGPGRVQAPEGTVHVLRQLGPTLVMYSWLPGAAQDPSAPEIQAALEELGTAFPIAP